MREKTIKILDKIKAIRAAIDAESISYGEIEYLYGARYYIKKYFGSDIVLRQWAGIKE